MRIIFNSTGYGYIFWKYSHKHVSLSFSNTADSIVWLITQIFSKSYNNVFLYKFEINGQIPVMINRQEESVGKTE